MRTFETHTDDGEVSIRYEYHPPEKETREEPGSGAGVTIDSIKFDGEEMHGTLPSHVLEHYEEECLAAVGCEIEAESDRYDDARTVERLKDYVDAWCGVCKPYSG